MKQRAGNHLKSRAWVAIFALLVQALLPAIVYAGTSGGNAMAEVCTAFGVKKVASSDDTSSGMAAQHCPLCTLAHLFALPGKQDLALPLSAATFEVPALAATQLYVAPQLSPFLRGPPQRF